MQEVIADYEGTVLIVSHDRDFLDRTVTITLGLDGSGNVDVVAGGYEDWAKRRNPVPFRGGVDLAKLSGGGGRRTRTPTESPAPPLKGRGKLSYKDQRDLDRLPAEIAAAEERWLQVAELADEMTRA